MLTRNRIGGAGVCLCIVLPVWAWQQPDTAAAAAGPLGDARPESGSVQGSVLNSQSGEPLKKAQILLSEQNNNIQLRAVTDASGQFKLKGVPAGSYRVTVSRSGFVPFRARRDEAGRSPDLLTIGQLQEIAGLLYRLAPGSVIAGRVVDEDGAPFAGVRLQCLRYIYGGSSRQLTPTAFATSDDRGQYRLAGLPPGRYFVRASYTDPDSVVAKLAGGAEQGYPSVYYPGVADAGQAAEIALSGGEEKDGVDLKLSPAPVFHIHGTVRGADGRPPAKGFGVSITSRMSAGLSGRSPAPVEADGTFQIEGVTPGSYVLTAFAPLEAGDLARQALELGEANLDNVHLVLKRRVDQRGRVQIEEDRKVRLEGLSVFLRPEDDTALMQGGAGMASVAADGAFVFRGVSEGDYSVQIGQLPEDCFLKTVKLADRPAEDRQVHIGEASAAGALDLLVSASGGRVTGTLTDDKQQPVTSSTVVLVPDAARRSRADLFRTAVSDQYGHFTFRGVPPGDYKLFAWTEDLEPWSWRDPAVLAPYEDQGKPVTLEEGGRVSADLQPLAAAH